MCLFWLKSTKDGDFLYTFNSIKEDLLNMGIDPKGTLLVHSSMKSIGNVDGGAETVLDAFIDYMRDGLLIFPTHTWADIDEEHPVFDSRSSKSCTGILTNLFMKRQGAVRSLHPTHSVAAMGRDAKEYTEGEELAVTPAPKSGCWGRLYDRNATVLFVGCRLDRNTFIHSVEEWSNVPDRLGDLTSELEIIDGNGVSYKVNMHRHECSFTDDISRNYVKLEPVFLKLGALKQGKLGDARCLACSARDMGDITCGLLKRNPALFADNEPVPTNLY